MSKQNPIIIDTIKLSKNYNGVEALKNLDLKVRKNSIYGFLGPNGAGKTTAIKLLLGLIKPTSGTGTIFNHDITRESIDIRSRVGYLPQEPRFYEDMTAREILRFTARFFFSGPKIEIKKRINEMLELVNIEDKADRPIKGFSGGERQRLGIAQAMINFPDLLILDEPTASLDPLGRHMILKLMEKIRKYSTIFYSTHILDDVQRVSDTVGILNRGIMVAKGNVDKLLAGSEETIYLVILKGNTDPAYKNISEQSWIKNIETDTKRGETQWQITVSDDDIAEEKLLRLILADKNVRITDYRIKKYELEDIFLQVVEGEENV
ncbi:MAG: ABC transporter ATP-binding protein [Promethearchaeota archaeon]|jgi:ABC-2 type transport system ATP-binding protein